MKIYMITYFIGLSLQRCRLKERLPRDYLRIPRDNIIRTRSRRRNGDSNNDFMDDPDCADGMKKFANKMKDNIADFIMKQLAGCGSSSSTGPGNNSPNSRNRDSRCDSLLNLINQKNSCMSQQVPQPLNNCTGGGMMNGFMGPSAGMIQNCYNQSSIPAQMPIQPLAAPLTSIPQVPVMYDPSLISPPVYTPPPMYSTSAPYQQPYSQGNPMSQAACQQMGYQSMEDDYFDDDMVNNNSMYDRDCMAPPVSCGNRRSSGGNRGCRTNNSGREFRTGMAQGNVRVNCVCKETKYGISDCQCGKS